MKVEAHFWSLDFAHKIAESGQGAGSSSIESGLGTGSSTTED